MDREAWSATVHGVQRVRHDLVTGQQQQQSGINSSTHSSPASNLYLTPRQPPDKTQRRAVEHMERPPPHPCLCPTVCFCAKHLHTSDLAWFSTQICTAVLRPLFTDEESSLRRLRILPPHPAPAWEKELRLQGPESSPLSPHREVPTCSSPNRTCCSFLNRLYLSSFFAYTPFSPVHFENYE